VHRLHRAAPGPPAGRDELGTPDILLLDSNELAVFDNLKGRLYLIVHADPRVDGLRTGAGAPGC
jgi:anthranilate/para-aminobenzoate synthase component I